MQKLIAKNPVARHNYEIIDKIEAGIVLYGTEIKSRKNGRKMLSLPTSIHRFRKWEKTTVI